MIRYWPRSTADEYREQVAEAQKKMSGKNLVVENGNRNKSELSLSFFSHKRIQVYFFF